MKTDLLASRHIGINEQDTAIMLRKIGVKTNYIPHISVWDGTTRSLRPLSSGMYSKTQYGILLTLRTRQRYRKDVWKH